jgi:hypothetical protein
MADAGSTDPRPKRSNAGLGAAYPTPNSEEPYEWTAHPDSGGGSAAPRSGNGQTGEDAAVHFDTGSEPGSFTANIRINDAAFMHDLGRLKELRSFLIQEAVQVRPSDAEALEFGRLNLLKRNYLTESMGRDPTEEEWMQVERHRLMLLGLLTPTLRRRFVLGAVPAMLAWLPMGLALVALLALMMAIWACNVDALHMRGVGANVLPFYLIWLVSLGAIGSVAFTGMNALSVQEDITFDLTNRRLFTMRIALGALFGLVLTLPFGIQQFIDFCSSIVTGPVPGQIAPPTGLGQATMLILPFVLGFSTSLVILILNRFIEAVQGFFGRRTEPSVTNMVASPSRAW